MDTHASIARRVCPHCPMSAVCITQGWTPYVFQIYSDHHNEENVGVYCERWQGDIRSWERTGHRFTVPRERFKK
jgi:hypothetical protein